MSYQITGEVLKTATAIASVAVIAVLAAEGLKILLPLRRWFMKREVESWLGSDYFGVLIAAATGKEESSEQKALFDQPTPRLLGVIQNAAMVLLDGKSEETVIRLLVGIPSKTYANEQVDDDVRRWVFQESLPARDVLQARLERRLDALQARLEYRWTQTNKWISVIVATAAAGIVFYNPFASNSFVSLLYVGAVVLIAAVLSALIENLGARRTVA
jgi:hypothetical protein